MLLSIIFAAMAVPSVFVIADESWDYNALGQRTYGVDVSFPIHYGGVSTNYEWLPHNVDPKNNSTPEENEGMPVQFLGNRQEMYDRMLEGCKARYKKGTIDPCQVTEDERMAMNIRQPQSVLNYTELGFKKIRAPDDVFNLIKAFWDENRGNETEEEWPAGNTYTNHWEAPTYMLSVENTEFVGGGEVLKEKIWELAHNTIQEWTGQKLTPCSLYGIRKYVTGAVLATHVDRFPLVTSAIINVAQDVDEEWELEVIGHDGKAYNITMEPGDMVLYESHSLLHGRPFPLKGRYYANIFIHFEPIGPEEDGDTPIYTKESKYDEEFVSDDDSVESDVTSHDVEELGDEGIDYNEWEGADDASLHTEESGDDESIDYDELEGANESSLHTGKSEDDSDEVGINYNELEEPDDVTLHTEEPDDDVFGDELEGYDDTSLNAEQFDDDTDEDSADEVGINYDELEGPDDMTLHTEESDDDIFDGELEGYDDILLNAEESDVQIEEDSIDDDKNNSLIRLPPYLMPNTPGAEYYLQDFEDVEDDYTAHHLAQTGDVKTLTGILESDESNMLHGAADVNGWLPIHEAARAGHTEIVKLLLDNGADVNARTAWGGGQSALSLAYQHHHKKHSLVEYLLRIGAEAFGPEL